MLPAGVVGKVFRSSSGELFGAIRPVTGAVPSALNLVRGDVFAEDECGNYFLRQRDRVVFWDHEDGEFSVLAETFDLFLAALEQSASAVLKQSQVKRAWIDPAFTKSAKKGPKGD